MTVEEIKIIINGMYGRVDPDVVAETVYDMARDSKNKSEIQKLTFDEVYKLDETENYGCFFEGWLTKENFEKYKEELKNCDSPYINECLREDYCSDYKLTDEEKEELE